MENTNSMYSKKASDALKNELEDTAKNIKLLMERAGCKEYKSTKVRIPLMIGSNDDVLFVGMNGQRFYFKRGETVNMPDPLVEILTNCNEI